MDHPTLLPLILGLLTAVCALSVVCVRNPVVSAMMLMATLFLTGGLYFGMGSYFIGAIQILVYAGAIAVLFVFIIMLLDLKPAILKIPGRGIIALLAAGAGLLMLSALVLAVLPGSPLTGGTGETAAAGAMDAASPVTISLQLLSTYMLPFQVTGFLILAAIMGAVVLGRNKEAQ